ncbi:MAG: hypothetical protein WCK73_06520 [Deltaproteobacteria bacterium]
MPARVDLVVLRAAEYAATRSPRVLGTTPARYLTLDGEGKFGGPEFEERAAEIHRLLQQLRERAIREQGKDFRPTPQEALAGPPCSSNRSGGGAPLAPWKLLRRIPAFVRTGDLTALWEEAPAGAGLPPARIEELREGRCIQSVHVGPIDGVTQVADRLRRAAADLDLVPHGRLHCAWLSDPGRTPRERGRILVRVPVKAR